MWVFSRNTTLITTVSLFRLKHYDDDYDDDDDDDDYDDYDDADSGDGDYDYDYDYAVYDDDDDDDDAEYQYDDYDSDEHDWCWGLLKLMLIMTVRLIDGNYVSILNTSDYWWQLKEMLVMDATDSMTAVVFICDKQL